MDVSSSFLILLHVLIVALFSVSGLDHVDNIFILAGQSNMVGQGGVTNGTWDGYVPPDCQPNPSIYQLNEAFQWVPAREPLFRCAICGIGPGMAFANDAVDHESGSEPGTIGLVPTAMGGTAISQWVRGGVPYMRMVQWAQKAMEGGGTLKALLWYQGESDTVNLADATAYANRMALFVQNVRMDLNSPNLPIIQVALATGLGPYKDEVRNAQLGLRLPNLVTVDAKGLQAGSDHVHLNTNSQVQLGHMLADAYRTYFSI